MSVLSHLKNGLESLRSARDEAGMGTSLMLDPIIQDLERLVDRTENIDNDSNNED